MTPEKFTKLKKIEKEYLDIVEQLEDNNYDDRGILDDSDPEDWCPEYW